MATQDPSNERIALLQGILDVLILRTLLVGPQHGQGIARAIQEQSQDVLLVDHGTIHPALQRLESKGWIDAKWGTSANNHRGRFYTQRQQKLCTNLTISAQAQSLLPAATPPQRCQCEIEMRLWPVRESATGRYGCQFAWLPSPAACKLTSRRRPPAAFSVS